MNSDCAFFPGLEEEEDYAERPLTACIEADLYGVKSSAFCPQCGQANVVVTLGASPNPYDLPCGEFKFFTFFGVTELPSPVVQALKKINPNYGPYPGIFAGELRYLNACAACRYVFDDEDLRVEPGDPFLPVETADYERIQLIELGHTIDYQLQLDEDECRTFDGIEVDCCNPAPDLWQVIVERQEL